MNTCRRLHIAVRLFHAILAGCVQCAMPVAALSLACARPSLDSPSTLCNLLLAEQHVRQQVWCCFQGRTAYEQRVKFVGGQVAANIRTELGDARDIVKQIRQASPCNTTSCIVPDLDTCLLNVLLVTGSQ